MALRSRRVLVVAGVLILTMAPATSAQASVLDPVTDIVDVIVPDPSPSPEPTQLVPEQTVPSPSTTEPPPTTDPPTPPPTGDPTPSDSPTTPSGGGGGTGGGSGDGGSSGTGGGSGSGGGGGTGTGSGSGTGSGTGSGNASGSGTGGSTGSTSQGRDLGTVHPGRANRTGDASAVTVLQRERNSAQPAEAGPTLCDAALAAASRLPRAEQHNPAAVLGSLPAAVRNGMGPVKLSAVLQGCLPAAAPDAQAGASADGQLNAGMGAAPPSTNKAGAGAHGGMSVKFLPVGQTGTGTGFNLLIVLLGLTAAAVVAAAGLARRAPSADGDYQVRDV